MDDQLFAAAIERIRQSDRDGLRQIYEAYVTYIYQVIYRILQNRENAEDVTTDFFIKLWDIADKYVDGSGHKTWITTIARNMALDFLRSHKRETLTEETPDLVGIDDEVSSSSEISHGMVQSEIERDVVSDMTVEAILSTLKESERQVINMKVLGDMTFKEIAETLNLPMGTVTWQYQNAIKKLRRYGYE